MVGSAQRNTLGLGVDIPENGFDDYYDRGGGGGDGDCSGTFDCGGTGDCGYDDEKSKC